MLVFTKKIASFLVKAPEVEEEEDAKDRDGCRSRSCSISSSRINASNTNLEEEGISLIASNNCFHIIIV